MREAFSEVRLRHNISLQVYRPATIMVKHGLVLGLLSAGTWLFAGCDNGASAQPTFATPAAPAMPAMQPLPTAPQLPQMPQPALPTPLAPTVQQPVGTGVDARTQWDEQRIAQLEQRVTALTQDNQSIHVQLAETQEGLRRMQSQAGAARRVVQGFRNQYQGQGR